MQETQVIWVRSLGQEDPLEEDMATHSSILAWETPWTEEPGKLQSMGSQRVRHDWGSEHTNELCMEITDWGLGRGGEGGFLLMFFFFHIFAVFCYQTDNSLLLKWFFLSTQVFYKFGNLSWLLGLFIKLINELEGTLIRFSHVQGTWGVCVPGNVDTRW